MPTAALLAIPIGAMLVPVLLALLARERALHARAEVESRWFAFVRRTQLLLLVGQVGWCVAGIQALPRLARFLDPVALGPLAMLGVWVASLAPIGLLPAIVALITNDVGRRLDTTEVGWDETLRRAGWLAAAAILTPLLFGLAWLAFSNRLPLGGLVLVLAGLVTLLFCVSRHSKGLELTPHAVTHGELRDRLFAMAARAGVKLQQLYVVPMRRRRLANAFAVNDQRVMVTDLLLDRLSRAEVDAVLAHELAHLKRGDPLKLLLIWLGCGVLVYFAYATCGGLGVAVAMPAAVLGITAFSRRMERATDREALRLGAEPRAMISGLARLARVSHMPLRWNGWTGLWLTHPSIEQRAHAIGRTHGVPPEEIGRLLLAPADDSGHYVLPESVDGRAPLFSSLFKQRTIVRNVMMLALVALVAPAAVLALARQLGAGPEQRLLATLAALIAAPAACLVVLDLFAVQPLVRLAKPLATRLGLDRKHGGWRLAGLSPHAEPRIYEGFSNWELGFVRFTPDALEFAGEQARFALAAASVTRVECVPGPPGWIATRAVRITWEGGGEPRVFRISLVGDSGLHAIGPLAARFAAEVEAWRAAAGAARPVTGLPLPPTGEVTSADPRSLARWSGLMPLFVIDLVLGAVIVTVLWLPWFPLAGPGLIEVVLSAAAAQTFLMLPMLRKSKAGEAIAPAAKEDHRAAA